jgi:hypothetical protein
MSPKNPDNEACKVSSADFSSYRPQAILDLRNCGITTEEIMSAQIGMKKSLPLIISSLRMSEFPFP